MNIVFPSATVFNITDEELRKYILSERQATELLVGNPGVLAAVLRTKITKEEIVAIGYRRGQLDAYSKLLADPEYFAKIKRQSSAGTRPYGKNSSRRTRGSSDTDSAISSYRR